MYIVLNTHIQEEQLKLEEKKNQQTLEAQQRQQGKQKLQTKHEASPSSVNPPKPYPKSMLRQPPSPTQPKQKSVTIREDPSIIQNMDDCAVECGLCGPGECVCSGEEEGPIDVSDSVTSTGGGLTRTDTFHNIFEERKYNISRRDLIHSTGSRSLPAIHPSGKQVRTHVHTLGTCTCTLGKTYPYMYICNRIFPPYKKTQLLA